MPALKNVTPVILTYNEAPNIRRLLSSLDWADRVLVIDSHSSDQTREIAREFPNTEILTRPFDDHASQWNFGLSKVKTEWVLTLDADYSVPPALVGELAVLPEESEVGCYLVMFDYYVFGKKLRSSLYPSRPILFRRAGSHYEMDGHTQRLVCPSPTASLARRMAIDDSKDLGRWLANQAEYSIKEAKKLCESPVSKLSLVDRIRKRTFLAPVAIMLYGLIYKRLILDGWRGVFYVGERVVYELVLSLQLLRKKFSDDRADVQPD